MPLMTEVMMAANENATRPKVLVVDDEIEHREYLADVIGSWGHEVAQAGDGEEAIHILAGSVFNVLITDLMMPRVDGFELLRTLGASGRLPPAIVMTAFGSLEKALDILGFAVKDGELDPDLFKLFLEAKVFEKWKVEPFPY